MAHIFTRFFPSKRPERASVAPEYPWLEQHPQYGQGFRISRACADDGFGYGSMPDITAFLKLDPTILQAVRAQYSWLAILDECIHESASAEKHLLEEFVDCTGFSDVSWWITIPQPEQWLDNMRKTIQRLFEHA